MHLPSNIPISVFNGKSIFIFVFDPLAKLLLISANKAFSIVQNNSEEFRSTVEDHRDYFRPPHPSDAENILSVNSPLPGEELEYGSPV